MDRKANATWSLTLKIKIYIRQLEFRGANQLFRGHDRRGTAKLARGFCRCTEQLRQTNYWNFGSKALPQIPLIYPSRKFSFFRITLILFRAQKTFQLFFLTNKKFIFRYQQKPQKSVFVIKLLHPGDFLSRDGAKKSWVENHKSRVSSRSKPATKKAGSRVSPNYSVTQKQWPL